MKKEMNDNLFCALVCILPAIFFWAMVVNGALPLMLMIAFICAALFFTLSGLGYAAWYTNDIMES